MKKWFSLWWYEYLFSFDQFSGMYGASLTEKLVCIWCRLKGHPSGPVWYSSGFDPNMQCKDCGEDL